MFSTKSGRSPKGLRFRLTAVYSTLFGLFICIFAFILTDQSLTSSRKDFDSALLNYSIDLSEAVKLDPSGFKVAMEIPPNEMKKHFPFTLGKTFYIVRSIKGEVLAQSQSIIPKIPYKRDLALKEDYTHRFQFLTIGGLPYRAVNLKVSNVFGQAYIVQVATPASILENQKNRYVMVSAITIPLLILISSLLSFWIAGNSLAPIKNLISTANNIAAQNLSLRVPEINTGDEIGELSRTLNDLLHRLEGAFKAQENFVANASHQLNTPLSIIKGELNVLESKSRSPEEVMKFHKSLKEELDRLIDLVKHMLLISRVESGQESFVMHPLRIDELLLTSFSRLTLKAREKKISIRFDIDQVLGDGDQLVVLGDKQLLDCLFENLVDNAIKYSPENSVVKIHIGKSPGLEVQISDDGPGIDHGELVKIKSQRFHRGSTSLGPGTGIGLSIAYKVAEFHSVSIDYVKREPQGSLFSIKFPQ